MLLAAVSQGLAAGFHRLRVLLLAVRFAGAQQGFALYTRVSLLLFHDYHQWSGAGLLAKARIHLSLARSVLPRDNVPTHLLVLSQVLPQPLARMRLLVKLSPQQLPYPAPP